MFFFFCSLERFRFLSLFAFIHFSLWSVGTAKSTIRQVFIFCWLSLGCLDVWPRLRWSVCISKSQRILCVSFSRMDSWFCLYHLLVWSNLILHFPHPVVSSLILFLSKFTAFAYDTSDRVVSIYIWSTSAILLRLVYTCLDIVLMALFCVSIRRESVSLLRYPPRFFLVIPKFSRVSFCLFVTWNVHTVVLLPIFVFWLFLFSWCLCWLYCFWLLLFYYFESFYHFTLLRVIIILLF